MLKTITHNWKVNLTCPLVPFASYSGWWNIPHKLYKGCARQHHAGQAACSSRIECHRSNRCDVLKPSGHQAGAQTRSPGLGCTIHTNCGHWIVENAPFLLRLYWMPDSIFHTIRVCCGYENSRHIVNWNIWRKSDIHNHHHNRTWCHLLGWNDTRGNALRNESQLNWKDAK